MVFFLLVTDLFQKVVLKELSLLFSPHPNLIKLECNKSLKAALIFVYFQFRRISRSSNVTLFANENFAGLFTFAM